MFQEHMYYEHKSFYEEKINQINEKIVELNSILKLEDSDYDQNEIKKDLIYAEKKLSKMEQKLYEYNYQIFMLEQEKLPKNQRVFQLARLY